MDQELEDALIGQDHLRVAVQRLMSCTADDHVPTVLVVGEVGSGARELGRALIRRWTDRDDPPLDYSAYQLVMDDAAPEGPEDRRYALAKVRALLSHRASGTRAMLLALDRAGVEVQNALLKVVEEPPPATRLVLWASTLGRVLETVRSRCQTLVFRRPSREQLEQWAQRHQVDPQMAQMAGGSLPRLRWLLQHPEVGEAAMAGRLPRLVEQLIRIGPDKERGLTQAEARRAWCEQVLPVLSTAGFADRAKVAEALEALEAGYKPEGCLAIALL